ncbi:MAG TPA: thiamine pyrophosphate-dependent enzyme [Terracidiphilus sp.]|nr:thiamine pyrophosphate-dependent enzyme [Terracidiphilus sp.]
MTAKSNEQPYAVPPQPAKNGFSLISSEKLLQLYSTMLKCRMIEDRTRILFNNNDFTANYDSAAGREAVAVGVSIDLFPEDTIVPSHGDLIPFFINGLPLETLLGGLFHPIAPSSGTAARLNLATDAAMANKLNKNNRIAVVISASEPASLGPWQEALCFAGLHGLPMIFVSWILSIPLKTDAYAFPAITVDGNDVVAVYRVASEAIAHARKGNGPTLIECQTGRSDGYSEIGSGRFHDPVEVECWKAGDPILRMEKYLIRKGLFSEEFKKQIAGEFSKELNAAIESADKLSLQPKQLKNLRALC